MDPSQLPGWAAIKVVTVSLGRSFMHPWAKRKLMKRINAALKVLEIPFCCWTTAGNNYEIYTIYLCTRTTTISTAFSPLLPFSFAAFYLEMRYPMAANGIRLSSNCVHSIPFSFPLPSVCMCVCVCVDIPFLWHFLRKLNTNRSRGLRPRPSKQALPFNDKP